MLPSGTPPASKPDFPWPRTLRAFRHRNYRLFFAGQLISLIGTWMQSVAQAWLVYRLAMEHPSDTQTPAALLGLVGFCGQIPVFALAVVGGIAADRFSRRRVILATQLSSMLLALILAGLQFTGSVQIWHVLLLAGLLGVVNAFDIPARQAFVVDLVGKADIVNAVALNSTMFNGARVIGPAVAGLLVAAIGEQWCFLLNGLSYIAVIISLLRMDVQRHLRVTLPGSPIGSVLEGFAYAWRTRPVRALLFLLGLMSLLGVPYIVLLPILTSERFLNGGASGYGILMGAAGVGATLGAISLAMRDGIRGLGRWLMAAACGFGVGLIVFSFSRTFWLSAALLVPVGYCMMVTMAAANTLVQSLVPDHLRGRVMAVYSMMFMGMAPFGALLAGVLAQWLDVPGTIAVGGAACIVGSLIFGWQLPALRQEAREIIVALEAAAGQPAEAASGDGTTVAALK
jgi:MFS family permease